jgi:histone-lysine N-methyltransferase SETDB1
LLYLQQLVNAFLENKSLLECDFPDHTMEVEISDSDESDEEKKREPHNDGMSNF